MRCRDALRLSSAYVDGELDERPTRAVRGHLRTCPACAAAAEDEARLRRAAAALEPVEPPARLWSQIEARLAADEIVEAGRSPVGLRVLCALDRLRRHALPTLVAVTAVVLGVVWLSGPSVKVPLLFQVVAAPAPRSAHASAAAAPTPWSIEDDLAADQARLVSDHAGIVAELTAEVAVLRPGLRERDRRHLDRQLAAAAARVAAARAGHGKDDLLSAYRAQIALLTRAVSRSPALALAAPAGVE